MPARSIPTRLLGRCAALLLLVCSVTLIAQVSDSAVAAGGAISTTTNVAVTGACLHPGLTTSDPDPVNCNVYADKADVWLSNLPQALSDGDYFFAVLSPGQQPDPNDGGENVLSAGTYVDRTFTVSNGAVSTTGSHAVVGNKIQLADFADTTNNGGVYVVAVCSTSAGVPVAASDCKYDAFKVGPSADDAADLVVTKDATGSYTRTYAWTIVKTADKTTVHQTSGNVAVNYNVAVSHDAGTDSAIAVTGTIHVFNPNNAAVLGVDVTDTLSDNTSCTVTGGADATIGAGDNSFPYSCSLGSLPQGQLNNTAYATWDDQFVDGAFLGGTTADFTFPDITFTQSAVDACVSVTDTVQGALDTSYCVGDANDGTAFIYQRVIPVTPGCHDYGNTASYLAGSGATDSSSWSVRVCGPLATGALTIGFWSNKNGQGVIGSSTTPGCASAAYLAGFAPFQDLSATASCKAVATYVGNVIAAANASGASMNKMLKAQMLATALDVWFTGGGSTTASLKYLPHSNLGAAAIDLTFICKNPLACTIFENVSSSFGGATSLTVSQMLAYAAGQSNAGGSTWYGNVKTVQEKAKDAFDAINNQVAFGP